MSFEVAIISKQSNQDILTLENRWNEVAKIDGLNSFFSTAHHHHHKSLDLLCSLLSKEGIGYSLFTQNRNECIYIPNNFKLWISLGGDGTFLYAARQLKHTPLLGINSSPSTSVGSYCKFNLLNQYDALVDYLHNIESGLQQPNAIDRLDLYVNGKSLEIPILNDCLMASSNPAETSFYLLEYNSKFQQQRSSGIWISTATGSTAAFTASGGTKFNAINSKGERQFAIRVRELYSSSNQEPITDLFVSECENFSIYSGMARGSLFIDGFVNKFDFVSGDTLQVKFYPHPLLAYL